MKSKACQTFLHSSNVRFGLSTLHCYILISSFPHNRLTDSTISSYFVLFFFFLNSIYSIFFYYLIGSSSIHLLFLNRKSLSHNPTARLYQKIYHSVRLKVLRKVFKTQLQRSFEYKGLNSHSLMRIQMTVFILYFVKCTSNFVASGLPL